MAQKEFQDKQAAEKRQRDEAQRKQDELQRKINELKKTQPENTEDTLTLKMGDKKISITGLNEKDPEYVQLSAEPKTKSASDLETEIGSFTSEEKSSSEKEVTAAKAQMAKNEETKK